MILSDQEWERKRLYADATPLWLENYRAQQTEEARIEAAAPNCPVEFPCGGAGMCLGEPW